MVDNPIPNPSGVDFIRATPHEPYKNSAGPQGSGLDANHYKLDNTHEFSGTQASVAPSPHAPGEIQIPCQVPRCLHHRNGCHAVTGLALVASLPLPP